MEEAPESTVPHNTGSGEEAVMDEPAGDEASSDVFAAGESMEEDADDPGSDAALAESREPSIADAGAELGDDASAAPETETEMLESEQPTAPEPETEMAGSEQSTAPDPETEVLESEQGAAPKSGTRLPISKIKKIMKFDPEVVMANQEAVFLVAKAAEMFIEGLVKHAGVCTQRAKRKTVQKGDIELVVDSVNNFAFLEGVIETM